MYIRNRLNVLGDFSEVEVDIIIKFQDSSTLST